MKRRSLPKSKRRKAHSYREKRESGRMMYGPTRHAPNPNHKPYRRKGTPT